MGVGGGTTTTLFRVGYFTLIPPPPPLPLFISVPFPISPPPIPPSYPLHLLLSVLLSRYLCRRESGGVGAVLKINNGEIIETTHQAPMANTIRGTS